MATVTYKTCSENAQAIYNAASAELVEKIAELEKNTQSLTGLAARPFADIKDQLKELNTAMLTYYSETLPTVAATRERGLKAIAELRDKLAYLNEFPSLSLQVIEHLVRLGTERPKVEKRESELLEYKTAVQGNIRSLQEAIVKVDALQKPFLTALNESLRVQGNGEGTIGYMDRAWAIGTYAYLNKALLARNSPVEQAPSQSKLEDSKVATL